MMCGEKLEDYMGLALVMKLENSSLNCVLLQFDHHEYTWFKQEAVHL